MNALVAESQMSEALDVGHKAVKLRAVKDDWITAKKQKQGGNESFFIRDLLPVKVQESLVAHESITGNSGMPAVTSDQPIPRKSKKIGLAKYNLVHAYRNAKEQAVWGKKAQAAGDFLLAYNSGVLLPAIYETIGQIKERTIDALDKRLRENDDNYLCLCDGRGGWKKYGTTKYKQRKLSEAAKEIFLRTYLHGARPSIIMAIRATKMILAKQGIPESATESTFRRWFKEYKRFNAGVVCLAREGMKAYKDKYCAYISRDPNLLTVGQCLVADGKTLNFFIKHPKTGQPCRMTLIVFFDWKSRYPVGWQIMPTENQTAILAAFRNGVETLGKYPESVYLDNGRAFKSKLFTKTADQQDFEELTGLYARVGTAVMFATPYNGRAKVVERFFNTFQNQFEFIMPSYCGDSIQTKPPWMHRNEKYQQALHKARTDNWIPNIREAALFIEKYVDWYAQQPHRGLSGKSPNDILLKGKGPGVDMHQLNHDFLWRIVVHASKCRITLWGVDYESDCLHNLDAGIPLIAMVNTADLRKIYCYTTDNIFLGEAYPVQACHPLARLFSDQVSVDQVTYEIKRQKRLINTTKRKLKDLGITKEARDNLNVLPFMKKVPVMTGENKSTPGHTGFTETIPGTETGQKNDAGRSGSGSGSGHTSAAEITALPAKEVKHLEAIMEKAEQEKHIKPDIPKPKYWGSDLEHYEWVFRLIHEHGREPAADDMAFMQRFQALPEFETSYRQRFDDLALILEF